MSLSIVIALFCSSIMLFSLFFIAKVHCSESRVNVGDDFITVFLKDRERVIKKSGSRMAISTYLLILGISPLAVGAFVYFFSQNGLFSILMAFMGFLIPDILLMIIRNSTQKKYEERYARALNQMGSSLRAGLSIARAVEDVAQCKFVHPSMQKCFAKLSADLQMGLPVSEAFQRMADDCGNEDAQDVALAIAVQDTVGSCFIIVGAAILLLGYAWFFVPGSKQTIKLTLRQLSLKNVQVFEQKEFPFAPFIFASCVLYGILRSLHVC